MFSVLKQLNINFKTQLSKANINWCKDYRYDFYFECNNEQYICEVNGIQHYEETTGNWKMKLGEIQLNDKLKKELALSNGIKEENYIVIDCRKSELEWIKQNIVQSNLGKLFDLSIIDWDECEEFALSNLVKVACEYKNNNPDLTTTEIGKLMKYHQNTIIKWLKLGVKLHWCNYDSKEEMRKSANKNRVIKQIEIFKDENSLGIFNSATDIERQSEKLLGVKLLRTTILNVCNGKRSHYKGYAFIYK